MKDSVEVTVSGASVQGRLSRVSLAYGKTECHQGRETVAL